jgi:ubiquinone biosynthesis protein UbiJ
MDLNYLVNQIKASPQGLRIRQGQVIAVNLAPASVDIQIAGDANTLPKVKYLDSYSPTASDTVWILSFGSDLLVIGKQA